MCFAVIRLGTLTLNCLIVDRNFVVVFAKDMDKDTVVLLATRAARMENQDSIDAAIVNMLADPKEVKRMRNVQTSEKFTSRHSTLLTRELLSLALIRMENAIERAEELLNRKFLRNLRRVKVALEPFVVCFPCLIPQGITVLRPFFEH